MPAPRLLITHIGLSMRMPRSWLCLMLIHCSHCLEQLVVDGCTGCGWHARPRSIQKSSMRCTRQTGSVRMPSNGPARSIRVPMPMETYLCLGYQGAAIAAFVGIVLFLWAALLTWCSSVVAAGGGGWWLARRSQLSSSHTSLHGRSHLNDLAELIAQGGEGAISESAMELGVSEEAVRRWWVHWKLAHLGPQRHSLGKNGARH